LSAGRTGYRALRGSIGRALDTPRNTNIPANASRPGMPNKTRDTNPSAWYPPVNGVVKKFSDMPAAYRANLDRVDVPFDGLPVSETPHMSSKDMADLPCFLETLTDGYVEGVTPQ
jgi:hypothetical protein